MHPSEQQGWEHFVLDRAHSLISEVVDVGASKRKAQSEAVVTEATRDDILKNQDLYQKAAGKLGTFLAANIKYAALSASHFTCTCNMFHSEVPHKDDRVTIDGKLSLDKLKTQDKTYHSIATGTIKFTVIPRYVFDLIPGFAWLIQAGKNTSIEAGEHELQVMERVHALARHARDSSGRVDFKAIKDRILMSKPRCMSAVPSMFTFVTHNGGSVADAFMLHDARDFIRAYCPSAHTISAESWALLAAEKSGSKKTPRFRWGVVQYMYMYGETSLKDSDLKKLTSPNMEVARDKADYMMNCLRSHASEACGELKGDSLELVGMMEINLTAATLGLKHMLHKNRDVVAHKFLLDLASHMKGRGV